MCSLGHHDGPELRSAPRRHTDGSVTREIAKTPRGRLAKIKADTTAQLRKELATDEADALAEQHGVQLELVPADWSQLPASSFRTNRLPAPETLYYSAARER